MNNYKINMGKFLIVLNYISVTSFFAFAEQESLRIGGFKLMDLVILITIGFIMYFLYVNKIKIRVTGFILVTSVFVLYLVLEFLVNSVLINGISFGYAFRSIRVFLFLVSFFLVYAFTSVKEMKGVLVTLIWLEFISSIIYNIQFITGINFLEGHSIERFRIGGLSFLRGYSGMPLMFTFDLIVLFFIRDSDIQFTRHRNFKYIMGFSILISFLATFTRGLYLIVFCTIVLYLLLNLKKESRGKAIVSMIFVCIGLIAFMNTTIFTGLVKQTQKELVDRKNSNIFLRVNVLAERYKYIAVNDMLYFGTGPRSDSDPSNNIRFFYGSKSQKGIFTDDMGYAALLLQYGLVGSTFYVCIFIYSMLMKSSKGKYIKAVKLQLLAYIVFFLESGTLLNPKYLFVIGILWSAIANTKDLDIEHTEGLIAAATYGRCELKGLING